MTDIKITSSTIYPEKHVGGLPVATPGYGIKCVFTVENKEPRLHSAVWWTIHDRLTDKRLESGTQAMAPGAVLNVLRYVTMPDKPIKLEFWTGFIDDGGVWRYTDSKKFREVAPLITKGSIGIVAAGPGALPLSAKAYVDAEYVGKTPLTVSRDAGSYMVKVQKDGYVEPPVQTVVVVPGVPAYTPFILAKEIPLPKLCLPSITGFKVPSSIPVTLPSLGIVPTVGITSFPVDFSVGGSCPSSQFPLDIILSVAGQEISGSATQWSNRIDIASTVKSVLQGKRLDELAGMKGIAISLKYPSKIEYSSPGTVKEWKTLDAYTRLDVSDLRKPAIPEYECTITAADFFTCPDGTVIQINKCVGGFRVPTGEKCPTPPAPTPTPTPPAPTPAPPTPTPSRATKMVFVTAPMLTRVGKTIKIVAKVYCGAEVAGGEKAIVTISGNILTTTHTRNGTVKASWTPVTPGIYNICVTVPESSACNAYASSCTTIQVVRELTTPEIEAAEKEFEEAQKRIGEIMERI